MEKPRFLYAGYYCIQIRVEEALEKCQTYRELTCCHRFSCRPVLLISCVVVRPSCVQKWILLEWLFSVLPFLVFSNSRYASNRGYKVVLGRHFKSMLSSSASSLSFSSSSPTSFSSSPSSWSSSSSLSLFFQNNVNLI